MIYHLVIEPNDKAPIVRRFNGRKIGRDRALTALADLVANPPCTGFAYIFCEDTGGELARVPLFCKRTLDLAELSANMIATARKLSGRF